MAAGTAYFPKVNPEDKGGVSIGGASLWALNNEDEAKKYCRIFKEFLSVYL